MNNYVAIRTERTFGELLGDGMKLVFKHLDSMGILLLTYVMPFIAASLIIIILNGTYTKVLDPETLLTDEGFMSLFSIYLIMGVGFGIGVVIMNLIVYSTIICYDQSKGDISAELIGDTVKKYAGNYAISVLTQIALGIGMMTIVSLFIMISPMLFGVVYFIMIIFAIWVFNILQFIGIVRIEEGLSIVEAIKRCHYLVRNQWWETMGLIVVTSLLGSILMYGIIVLFIVVFGIIAGLYNVNGTESSSFITYTLYGIFILLYLFIMSASNMYIAGVRILKYYDLVEKKEAKNLINAIEEIGQARNNLFENEGEF